MMFTFLFLFFILLFSKQIISIIIKANNSLKNYKQIFTYTHTQLLLYHIKSVLVKL